MNIGFISMGSAGTMGHLSLIKYILKDFTEKNINLYVISEFEYDKYVNLNNKNVHFKKVSKQKMMYSIAGKIDYKYNNSIMDILKDNSISHVFYSTFFDEKLIKQTRDQGIKSFLMSYPLRDTHERILSGKNYLDLFENYLLLKDLSESKQYKNRKVIHTRLNIQEKDMIKERNNNILVTLGGGGRPSSSQFLKLVVSNIEQNKIYNNYTFTFLMGAYNKTNIPKKNNFIVKKWSNNIQEEYDNANYVISEAGYFTANELLNIKKPSILIPGFRTIDNQELRGIEWELAGCGLTVLREVQKESLNKKMVELINSNYESYEENFIKKIQEYDQYPLIHDVIKQLIK